jgi:quercetin dioxygenase-like cupin family protein
MKHRPCGNGKGDTPRPIQDREKFDSNWDSIFKKKKTVDLVNFVKLDTVDISNIQKEILNSYSDFDLDTERQKIVDYHKNTKSYRLVKGLITTEKSLFDAVNLEKTSLYYERPLCVEFLNSFIKKYGGVLHRVSLVLLPPKCEVLVHSDNGEYYANKDRFHLVIKGSYNLQVFDETQYLKEGELWFFNNKRPHSAFNSTNEDRISMIFDVEGSLWRGFNEVDRNNPMPDRDSTNKS